LAKAKSGFFIPKFYKGNTDMVEPKDNRSTLKTKIFVLIGGLIKCLGWVCGGVWLVALLGTFSYAVYIWWNLINGLDFVSFSISIALFFITIPLAPIYLGVEGNWEPLQVMAVGVLIAYVFSFVTEKIMDFMKG
jgi:hypothetical protein